MPTIVRQLLFTPSSFNRRTDHQFVNEASMIADASFFFPGFFFFFLGGGSKAAVRDKTPSIFSFSLATQYHEVYDLSEQDCNYHPFQGESRKLALSATYHETLQTIDYVVWYYTLNAFFFFFFRNFG